MPNTPTVQDGPPLLVHIGKVAEQLGISAYLVKKLIDSGRLPSEKVGSRLYIPAGAVREYVAELEQAS